MQLSITSAGKSRRSFLSRRTWSVGFQVAFSRYWMKTPRKVQSTLSIDWTPSSTSSGQKSVIQFLKCSYSDSSWPFVIFFSFSESLYEDENFKHRELAALVSSKVYYHLGSLDNALTYALGAGRLFDVNDKTEYVETIIGQLSTREFTIDLEVFLSAHCIDKYTKLQVDKFQSDGSAHGHIDQRLEDIVNRMFQRCFDDKKYKQVLLGRTSSVNDTLLRF